MTKNEEINQLQRELQLAEAWISFHMEEIKAVKGNTPEAHALYKALCVKRNTWKVRATTAKSALVMARMSAGVPTGTPSSK
jgi:hypothetical protein